MMAGRWVFDCYVGIAARPWGLVRSCDSGVVGEEKRLGSVVMLRIWSRRDCVGRRRIRSPPSNATKKPVAQ